VELFNDIDAVSLGKQKRNGIGTHFRWDETPIEYNILYAVGYVNGKQVAKDTIVLNHLPPSPHFNRLYESAKPITGPVPGYNYLYRINCGGADYKDENGNVWEADRALSNAPDTSKVRLVYYSLPGSGRKSIANEALPKWNSSSWANDFPGMPAFFGSQRRTFDPVKGTRDWDLFRDFRYGKDKLQYEFPVPDGEYRIEFYFIEPWLGIGGGMDARGMRVFDIAVNGKRVLQNIDIWREAGTNNALKKVVNAKAVNGKLVISFPQSRSGQALISAIAIASLGRKTNTVITPYLLTGISDKKVKAGTWLDAGHRQYMDESIRFRSLPPNLYAAEWLQFPKTNGNAPVSFKVTADADIFIGINRSITSLPAWLKEYENTQTEIETDENGSTKYAVYRLRAVKNATVQLNSLSPNSAMYPVVVVPVSTMQPAYDLKPVTNYRTNVALVSSGVQKEMFAGRECAIVKSQNPVTMEWPVQTGVADIYSITVKYFYPSEQPLTAKMQLIGAGNTMMLEEPVRFTFTRTGKWNQFTFNTRTMINAGNYIVKLIVTGAEGLAVSGIEIQ
jgi:beta-galactosidase